MSHQSVPVSLVGQGLLSLYAKVTLMRLVLTTGLVDEAWTFGG